MLAGLTGRGVRIAVIDSGVNANHPHVGGVAGGVAIGGNGIVSSDYVDRLGHGTAVTAAIREKAPAAEIVVVKVFDRALATSITALVAAIDWAVEARVQLVNLSLGTSNAVHEAALRDAVARAASRRVTIVSAREEDGVRWLPGALPDVLAVQVNWSVPRDAFRIATIDGGTVFLASGFAREIPGVPPERNLHGVSLAVANMTGFAALAAESLKGHATVAAIATSLEGMASALKG